MVDEENVNKSKSNLNVQREREEKIIRNVEKNIIEMIEWPLDGQSKIAINWDKKERKLEN